MTRDLARPRPRATLRRLCVRVAVTAAAITAVPAAAAHGQLGYDYTTFLHGLGSNDSIWRAPYGTLGGRTPPQYLRTQVDLKLEWAPFLNEGAPGKRDSTPGWPYYMQRDILRQHLVRVGGRHVLVGHSLGSMVARGAFAQVGPTGVPGIVAIAAPHQGTLIANADTFKVAKRFITSLEASVMEAKENAKVLGPLATALSVLTLNPVLFVVGWEYIKGSQSTITFPTDDIEAMEHLAALPDLPPDSPTIAELNAYTGDGAIPRANVRGSIPHGHAILRLAASMGRMSFADLKRAKDDGLSSLRKCRNLGDLTFNAFDPGNACQRAARMLNALDRRWAGWVNGTQYGLVRGPMFLGGHYFGPVYGQVPRLVPFDGIVPNERSNYPGGGVALDRTVWMANHQDIYKIQDGLDAVAAGMLAMQMQRANGAPSVSISGPTQFSSSGTLTWTASSYGGNGTYSYQWKYRPTNSTTWTTFGTTGPSASRYVYSTTTSFVVRVTVTSNGQTATADRTVSNTNDGGGSNCGTQRVC